MTSELAKLILSRGKLLREAKQKDAAPTEFCQLWEMYFWDYNAHYFKTEDRFEEEHNAKLRDDEPFALEHSPFGPDEVEENTECDQMIIREDEVAWTTISKHSDYYGLTCAIKFSEVEKYIQEGLH